MAASAALCSCRACGSWEPFSPTFSLARLSVSFRRFSSESSRLRRRPFARPLTFRLSCLLGVSSRGEWAGCVGVFQSALPPSTSSRHFALCLSDLFLPSFLFLFSRSALPRRPLFRRRGVFRRGLGIRSSGLSLACACRPGLSSRRFWFLLSRLSCLCLLFSLFPAASPRVSSRFPRLFPPESSARHASRVFPQLPAGS